MSRVFVFGNSYMVRTVLQTIDCLLNFSVDEVIVLRENHTPYDQILLKGQTTLCILDTIDSCLTCCDQVLIMNSEDISEPAIKRLLNLAFNLDKKCYLINAPLSCGEAEILQKIDNDSSIPVILNISFGRCTQLFSIETLLNNMFYESNISIVQYFSRDTRNILNQFKEKGVLHKSLLSQMTSPQPMPMIAIHSINIGNSLYNLRSYIDYFNSISPDFIIFHTDAVVDVSESVHNIIQFCCLSQIDMIVKSHYTMVDDKYVVFCDLSTNNDVYDVESPSIKYDVFSRIVSKLTFPQDVKRLQFK